jgi:hypothetical protein
MAIEVVNKSRQAIPVDIIEKGVAHSVLLLSDGERASAISEGETITITNLAEKGLVRIRKVETEVVQPAVEDTKVSHKK